MMLSVVQLIEGVFLGLASHLFAAKKAACQWSNHTLL
ncbi:MAG: hypothetical protein ACI9WS_002043 [Paraglaciecola psychrophila]|jgi:hypothetical protein